ncbi:MAG: DUF4097 family beta strand repeat protein [Candidatus Sericytochromatia bacterium]|nr:DUF4097 family beta strand repeat protein [Candidatus Sericytochromatia bacterium]
MSETRKLILKMLQENRISIDEADQLLAAIVSPPPAAEAAPRSETQAPPRAEAPPRSGQPDETLLNKIPRVDQVMGSLGSMLDNLSQQVGPGLEKRLEGWFQQRSGQQQSSRPPKTAETPPTPAKTVSQKDQHLEVPSHCSKLHYQHLPGDLKVSGHERAEIIASFEIQLAPGQTLPIDPEQLRLESQQEDQSLTLQLHGAEAFKAEHGQIRLQLKVPASLDLALQTESHDIVLEQLQHPQGQAHLRSRSGDLLLRNLALKEIDLQSESGNLNVEQASEHLHIQTRSGDVVVKGSIFDGKIRSQSGSLQIEASVQHSLSAESSSGDLNVQLLAGQGHLSLQSQSGDIQLSGALQSEVSLNSASGDLQGDLQIAPSAAVNLISHSGDVDVILRPESQCQVELEAQVGEVTCRLPLDNQEASSHTLSGQLGNGEGRFKARTQSGDILIS